jgi:hypothetical protein
MRKFDVDFILSELSVKIFIQSLQQVMKNRVTRGEEGRRRLKRFFLQTSVKYDIAALIMLKCHFIVMASNELTSVREIIISADDRL